MAVPTNTYTRFTASTNVREDLIEKITLTNPEDTPVISSFGTATADNTFHEWQRDNLRAANKDNAALDGDDATASAKAPPVRVANVCQIFQDMVQTSGRVEAVKKAGMAKAMAYYKAKAYKEIQRDLEASILSANPAVLGSGAAASKSAGLGALIYTNVSHGATGSTTAHTSGAATVAPVAGTARAFTESLFKAAIQASYVSSGKIPPMAVMSPNHKDTFASFTGIAQNRVNIPAKTGQATVVGGADIYLSSFGKLEIVPHYLLAGASTVYGLNPDYGDAVYLRGFMSSPLAKTGDSTREQVIVDATVRLTSEQAHFKIADLII